MTDTLDAKETALARQAAAARAAIRDLLAYGSEREVLSCDVLGPQYVAACAKLAAAQASYAWDDMSPTAQTLYRAREADRLVARAFPEEVTGWRRVFMGTLHEGLALFATVGSALAWFFGTFVIPVAFAIHWTEAVSSPTLRALVVLLGASVMGIAYNVTVAALSGALHAVETWWRGRK